MKKIFTILFSLFTVVVSAQWRDTGNNFYDTLHTAVAVAPNTQKNPIVINSYPDSGYIVIWEDSRNTATTKDDIYAQKYDKGGAALWAVNGVAIANGTNRDHFVSPSNQDYRNRSYASTDSAGGFFMTYVDDSVSSYVWERITVQHIRSNGSQVFPGGKIVARSGAANLQTMPQLIGDGQKGFFLCYKNAAGSTGNDYIYMNGYKDVNGTLVNIGGGRANDNAIITTSIAPCGIKSDLVYPGTTVSDYNIWPDGQGGCNVIMSMNGNTGSQYQMLCYNRLWRCKKNSLVTTYRRNSNSVGCPLRENYEKDKVYMMYQLKSDFYTVQCATIDGQTVYVYTNFRLTSNGYRLIDRGGYDYNFAKGTTISTPGKLNVDLIAATTRSLVGNSVTNFIVKGYALSSEKYDSVPAPRASSTNPDIGYNPEPDPYVESMNTFRDTLLAEGTYYYDFSLASGGNNIYASALVPEPGASARSVRLNQLSVVNVNPDSFAIQYRTPKTGELIGSEIATGFGGDNISYDFPQVMIDKTGKGFFAAREYYRGVRVSPISDGGRLDWGAMGRPTSTGVYNGSFYNLDQPVVAMRNGSGVVAWKDYKNLGDNSSDNIFIRHLDKLNQLNYQPPLKSVKPLYFGVTFANPAVMMGTSHEYSLIEVYNPYGVNSGTSPLAQINDYSKLGRVIFTVFQNNDAIRKYNGQPYLNRNYFMRTEFPVAANIETDMYLYMTKTDFDALKNADHTIADPGFLAITQQPNVSTTTPTVYTPVTGEKVITPTAWDSVAGGYVLKFTTKEFGNFFVKKLPTTNFCGTGSTTFTSNLTGSTYVWQVNDGSGFQTISNGTNYGGATTATLQLNNVTTAFNGYRYRCIVNGVQIGTTFGISFQNQWTGTVSNLWENAGNWSCGTVPTATTDVVINNGTVVVNNSNAICKTLQLGAGVNVTVNAPYTLTVVH